MHIFGWKMSVVELDKICERCGSSDEKVSCKTNINWLCWCARFIITRSRTLQINRYFTRGDHSYRQKKKFRKTRTGIHHAYTLKSPAHFPMDSCLELRSIDVDASTLRCIWRPRLLENRWFAAPVWPDTVASWLASLRCSRSESTSFWGERSGPRCRWCESCSAVAWWSPVVIRVEMSVMLCGDIFTSPAQYQRLVPQWLRQVYIGTRGSGHTVLGNGRILQHTSIYRTRKQDNNNNALFSFDLWIWQPSVSHYDNAKNIHHRNILNKMPFLAKKKTNTKPILANK